MSKPASSLRIEPASLQHQVAAFDCGKPSINEHIRILLNEADLDELSHVYTAVDTSNQILGFYTFSSANIEFEEIPSSFTNSTETYPVSAIKIDVLAVDSSMQKKGLGARMLIDALQRIHNASADIDIKVVMVEASTAQLRSFYLHYGFSPLTREETNLFLPIEKVTRLFDKTSR